MMKRVFKAESIIQRDALQARLAAAKVTSESPDRDMSRKLTSTTVDLALNGYSVMFDGFEIYVDEADAPAAQKVIDDFVRESRAATLADQSSVPYWKRFYFCSIFSLMFPVLLSVLATYHLVNALRSGVRPTQIPTLMASVLLFICGWVLSVFLAGAFFKALF